MAELSVPDPYEDEAEELLEEPKLGRFPRRAVILWLIVASVVVLLVPLYLTAATLRDDNARLAHKLEPIQQALTGTPTPVPEVQDLMSKLAQAQAQSKALTGIQPTMVAEHANWPAIMAAIGGYDPLQLTITSLKQDGNRVTVGGKAGDDAMVVAYAHSLQQSGLFARVSVQSIQIDLTPIVSGTVATTVPAASTVQPTPTRIEPSVTAVPQTPTPSTVGDAYEPDDVQPKPIFLGQPQQHTFDPVNDVDKVFFLAKAGRTYQVSTSNLAPGVDTVLTIEVAGRTYTNDDIAPGTLASEFIFHIPLAGDFNAIVTVTNRGQYGPKMGYTLAVEEIVPTAAPAAVIRPPVNTSPPSAPPPATLAPPAPPTAPPMLPTAPPPPTATRDPRDAYEPDDTIPAPIVVGQIQNHNFYPAGDIDKVSFPAKAVREYQIFTSNLALGVDTVLTTSLNSQVWSNDDYALAGSNNYASAVCFLAPSDGTAVVTTTNRLHQYGADKTYSITVQEVAALTSAPTQLVFGPIAAGSGNPPSQSIAIGGSEATSWTASSTAAWITVSPASGATPSSLGVSVHITDLAPGTYQGSIDLAWASFCHQSVQVSLQVTSNPALAQSVLLDRDQMDLLPRLSPVWLAKRSLSGEPVLITDRFADSLPSLSVGEAMRSLVQDHRVVFLIIIELKSP